jgi:hypothetical protein
MQLRLTNLALQVLTEVRALTWIARFVRWDEKIDAVDSVFRVITCG